MKNQKTVLVVEDEQDYRAILVQALSSKKFLTLEGSNGREGVELALSKHPDLVLLDLMMPEMDGMTAFKKIRQDSWGANVPVIILTNFNATNEGLVEDVVNCKPFHYLVKSNTPISEIVKKIEEIFKT